MLDGYTPSDVERHGGGEADDDERSPFARDYDRLIYSSAFRRLQGKTQVVSPGEADFFRTRLTHTIEVAQVARRLAERLNRLATTARREAGHPPDWCPAEEELGSLAADLHNVDPDLCEAAAVLHDLGHPPFGHAGEEALNEVLISLTRGEDPDDEDLAPRWRGTTPAGFNGNAQSFRLAVHTLEHKAGVPGLQLTRATLDASLKYPWQYGSDKSDKSRKSWNVDAPQTEAFADVRSDVPEPLRHLQTIEAQIMDWADDVAYSVHDLDDWFRAGYMPVSELVNDEDEQARFAKWVLERWKKTEADEVDRIEMELHHLFGHRTGPFLGFRRPNPGADEAANPASDAAAQAIRVARGSLFGEFLGKATIVKRDLTPFKVDEAEVPRRYLLELCVPERTRLRNRLVKELLWRYVVSDQRMATQQHGQKHAVRRLARAYTDAAMRGDAQGRALFPSRTRAALAAEETSPDECLRAVVDYVSGMTDAYAAGRLGRLFDANARLHDFA